eukprot:2864118-Rhodomonas_salina.1
MSRCRRAYHCTHAGSFTDCKVHSNCGLGTLCPGSSTWSRPSSTSLSAPELLTRSPTCTLQ